MHNLEERSSQIAKKDALIKNQQSKIQALQNQIRGISDTQVPMCSITEKEKLAKELRQAQNDLQAKEDKEKTQEKLINEKNQEILEKEGVIKYLKDQIKAKQEELDHHQETIMEKSNDTRIKDKELSLKDKEIESLNNDIKQLETKIKQTNKVNRGADMKIEELQTTIESLKPRLNQLDAISNSLYEVFKALKTPQFQQLLPNQRLKLMQDKLKKPFSMLPLTSNEILPSFVASTLHFDFCKGKPVTVIPDKSANYS